MFDMLNSQYFNQLPSNIKEKVWECGIIFNVEEELREYVADLQSNFCTFYIMNKINAGY